MLVITKSPSQTQRLAQELSGHLKPGDIVALFGELGSGKTIFVKGLAKGLGLKKNRVNSPSFVLIREYKGKIPLYHFDFYRMWNLKDIYNLGIDDYFFKGGITAIEWAQRCKTLLPKDYLAIELEFINESTRKIRFRPIGSRYRNLIKGLEKIKNICVS